MVVEKNLIDSLEVEDKKVKVKPCYNIQMIPYFSLKLILKVCLTFF